MACAARCACSPRTVNLAPRRAMVTSSADSIWRRWASSAPHSRARRWLSTGSSLTSVGLAAVLLRIHELAAQRVWHGGGDPQVDERVNEVLAPREIDTRLFSVRAFHSEALLLENPST